MIKEAIGIAATIDEARKMATKNLNAPIDAEVKIDIIINATVIFLLILILH